MVDLRELWDGKAELLRRVDPHGLLVVWYGIWRMDYYFREGGGTWGKTGVSRLWAGHHIVWHFMVWHDE